MYMCLTLTGRRVACNSHWPNIRNTERKAKVGFFATSDIASSLEGAAILCLRLKQRLILNFSQRNLALIFCSLFTGQFLRNNLKRIMRSASHCRGWRNVWELFQGSSKDIFKLVGANLDTSL